MILFSATSHDKEYFRLKQKQGGADTIAAAAPPALCARHAGVE